MSNTRTPVDILLGLIFVVCGGLIMLFLALITTLDCRRIEPQQVDCQRRLSLLSRLQISQDAIPDVLSARVSELCDDGCTYRVELETRHGIVPLTEYYSSGSEPKQQMAGQINAFLANPQQTVVSARISGFDNAGLFVLIPFGFMLTGAWLAIRALVELFNTHRA